MYGAEERNRAANATGGSMEEAQSANEVWSRVKRRLRAELGEDVFASWFGRLELDAIVDGCARLTVPTRFLKSWIESHYADRVLATYRSEAPTVERISVAMRGSQVRDAVAKRPDGARPCATAGGASCLRRPPPGGRA